jgi:mannose-6-phosphate isomerase
MMLLTSHYVEKPWGRTDLPAVFAGASGRRIGEVWFDRPDDPLPLLVKWLFTSERLSVQVHPDDRQAQAAGEIENLIDWKPVKPGDFWFIPAGTIHAIGDGVRLVEIQQNSDMTYRLYDYGRPRELHLAQSMAVSKPAPYADPRCGDWLAAAPGELMACDHFRIVKLTEANADSQQGDAPVWVTPILGPAEVNGERVPVGSCAYAAGGLRSFRGEPALLAVAA